MVLNELEGGLRHHSLITSEEQRKRVPRTARRGEAGVRGHRQERGAARHQRRRGRHRKLCANYIDNIKAYTQKEKVRNKYTGQDEEPDERLMRSIEEKIDIPESRKDDFRREIMNYIGALAIEGKTVRLQDQRAPAQGAGAEALRGPEGLDQAQEPGLQRGRRETQEKIDVVKERLIKNFGYCEICSTDVLNYVASIFARGDAKE